MVISMKYIMQTRTARGIFAVTGQYTQSDSALHGSSTKIPMRPFHMAHMAPQLGVSGWLTQTRLQQPTRVYFPNFCYSARIFRCINTFLLAYTPPSSKSVYIYGKSLHIIRLKYS
jgi:hypothetical protein